MRFKQLLAMMPLLLLLVFAPFVSACAAGDNLLVNAGFEELSSKGLPVGWHTDGYINAEGYTLFGSSEDACSGGNSASVCNLEMNDARFSQTVKVEPGAFYRLSGYIKTLDVADVGWGANVSIDGIYITYEGVYGSTDGWVYTEIYGKTGPEQTSLTVYARLGGYSGETVGQALFDDLCLEKVDTVPPGKGYDLWYRQSLPVLEPVDDHETEVVPAPYWPWLVVIGIGYVLAVMLMLPMLSPRQPSLGKENRHAPIFMLAGFALAFAARYLIALKVDGYQVDVGCFKAWASTMAVYGPGRFYQATSFCDYPPAYLLVLGLNELTARALTALFGGILPGGLRLEIIMKLLPMLCDLGMAWLVYYAAREMGRMNRSQAGLCGLAMAFQPVTMLTSGAWCQIDAVMALLLALAVWFAVKKKWMLTFPLYMLAVLIKPQALLMGPFGLLVIAAEFFTWSSDGGKLRISFKKPEQGKAMLMGVLLALAVGLVIILPFAVGEGGLGWLFNQYSATLGSYDHATINAANLHYLFGGNWISNANSAPFGVLLLLAFLAGAWGLWQSNLNRRCAKAVWWLEGAAAACFAAAFLAGLIMGASWGFAGYLAMALSFTVVFLLYFRAGRSDVLPMLAGLLFLMLFVLGVKMHERYLFPALVMFAMAYAIHRDWRLMLVFVISGCAMFVNEGIVLDNSLRLGSSLGHLNEDTRGLANMLSVLQVLSVPLALWACCDLCTQEEKQAGENHLAALLEKAGRHFAVSPAGVLDFKTDAGLHWKRLDTLLVVGVTVAYSVLALFNLGSTKAPQTTWRSTSSQENIVIDLGGHYDDVAMLYYCRVSYSDFSVAVSDDGENWSDEYWAQMAQGQCYSWKYLSPCYTDESGARTYSDARKLSGVQRLSGRYVRITAQQVNLALNEVIFRDGSGDRIPARVIGRYLENAQSPLLSDPACVLDEQDTLEGEPSWYNSTYFDEIYHARTGMELLEGSYPYENTHPPLGKLMISACIAIFGMTPFGWRFAGCMMGILMLPAMYVLGKQLTKRSSMAFVAMSLMALDCMHYTQTRIATIDSFAVLFIILTFLFMVRFMQRDLTQVPVKKLLPDLALSGLFMGIGIASKWIVMYTGAGLACMFFWTCARHLRLAKQAKALLGSKNPQVKAQRQVLIQRSQAPKRVMILCLWCVLFFVVIPGIVYMVSFIPCVAYMQPLTFSEFFDRFLRMQYDPDSPGSSMYGYHSQPGLGMDHPFYSPWYEWPVMARPMYYYTGQFMPAGYTQSIFCFGNPAVWFGGLLGLAVVVVVFLKRHVYSLEGNPGVVHLQGDTWKIGPAAVMLGFLAEFLPWMLVPRGTYIYHYFASIPFLILGVMLTLHWFSLRFPRAGRLVTAVYLLLTLGFFVFLYPYASGVTTSLGWLDLIRRLKFLNVYYIL